ncbi:MAG: hypothetical protein ACW98Y_16765 [Candidatus Thorarchaeota archaeon]|jgi:hypothetical protein
MKNNSTDKPLREVSSKYSDKILTARAATWDVALAEISVGLLKAKIAGYAKDSYVYDETTEKWIIHLKDEKLKAGQRIALVLLFHYPQKMSRDALSSSTGIQPDSLVTYLSKSKPEISDNINESEGVTLNKRGFHWASEILDSLIVD